jgi:Kdo2-lipid IVA lauroyltransferase/acyltransferase
MSVVYFFLALLARLPLPWLRSLGWLLGSAVYLVNKKRRHISRVNLGIAFPMLDSASKETLVKRHLRTMGVALFDRVWLWFAPLDTVYKRIQLTGFEHLPSTQVSQPDGEKSIDNAVQPVILLIPHFAGLEAAGPAWVAQCLQRGLPKPQFTTVFQPQRTAWEDALFRRGRGRFAPLTQYTRRDGIRPVIKSMRQGCHYYCLPDNDFGAKDAVFVPFFGQSAATITVLPKLSALMGAAVIPLVTRMTKQGYTVQALPAMAGMGQGSIEADCAAMNTAIEAWVRTMPEQYLFSHRRYKTRPEGEASVY